MKILTFSTSRAVYASNHVVRLLFFAAFLICSAQVLHAQASISVQGILKKSTGVAVDDGVYTITFKLYTVETGGTALWTEMQNAVEIINGIYSTVLGNTTALNVPFNQVYYIGVTVGAAEMQPRIQLTSTPYALSMLGQTNQFPSVGLVKADSMKVNGGVLAKGGAPGLNGANHNGYAFSGNSGDKDSGLFSTSDGKVSMYVNNVEMLVATPDSIGLRADLRLKHNGNINYNGLDDWRLVEVDYFEDVNNNEGWQAYNPTGGEPIGWSNQNNAQNPVISGSSSEFYGNYIREAASNQVLKKQFNLSNVGTYNFIKVKFRYYFLDTWDGRAEADRAFAAIAETATGTGMVIGWAPEGNKTIDNPDLNTTAFQDANKWATDTDWSEYTEDAEMTFYKCGPCNNIFWLMFGASLTGDKVTQPFDEIFGVGMIEIWVK